MIKFLVIFLGIGVLLFIVLTILCAMVLAGRADEENDNTRTETGITDGIVPLCPQCKVGQKSYALDQHSEACPYLSSWKTGKCSHFVPIEPSERTGNR